MAGLNPRKRLWIEAAATIVFLVVVLLQFARFVTFIEQRPGVVLADPLLARFAPRDVTWLVFGALYGALVITIGLLVKNPPRLLAGCQAYAVMVLLRFVMMWAAPFDPPPTAIPLADPFVSLFGPSQALTRDLFFSGHTATSTLVALAAPKRWANVVLGCLAAAIASGVILQHVHYTIDVLVAVPVAFSAWRLVLTVRKWIGLPDVT